jgi:hypothetical protein
MLCGSQNTIISFYEPKNEFSIAECVRWFVTNKDMLATSKPQMIQAF